MLITKNKHVIPLLIIICLLFCLFVFGYKTTNVIGLNPSFNAISKTDFSGGNIKFENVRNKNSTRSRQDFTILQRSNSTASKMATEEICRLKKNVMFLKTHKTASSTIQNILFRYGVKHNLTFALPKFQYNFLYSQTFNKRSVLGYPGRKNFNIICHHMRFSYPGVREIMPSDSVYISILRNPTDLFQSTFVYFYGYVPEFHHVTQHSKNSVEMWLNNTSKYWNPDKVSRFSFFAKNHLMFDFGYSAYLEDMTEITKAINEINQTFDLILISDYMDESLVLLADLLCCPLTDVVALKLNSQGRKAETTNKSPTLKQKVRNWVKADSLLYEHFNATLWKKIKAYGFKRMKRNVEKLNKLANNLVTLCVVSNKTFPYSGLKNVPWDRRGIYEPPGVTIKSYDLKPGSEKLQDCVDSIAPELYFTNELKKKQKHSNIS